MFAYAPKMGFESSRSYFLCFSSDFEKYRYVEFIQLDVFTSLLQLWQTSSIEVYMHDLR